MSIYLRQLPLQVGKYRPIQPIKGRIQSYSAQHFEQMLHGETFFLDEFADRQWDDPEFSGKIE
jgi:hypothetical protein